MALDPSKVLVQLADVKRYLNIADSSTTHDRLLNLLITHASIIIRNEVGCDILRTTYTGKTKEVHSGNGSLYLWLNHWPLVDLNSIAINTDDALVVTYSGSATHALIAVNSTGVRLRTASAGAWTNTTLASSDYSTIATMEDAITAVSGWTATEQTGYENYPSTELIISPARDADDRNVTLRVPETCQTDYEIWDADQSLLYNPYGWDSGQRNIFVDYTAGYLRTNVPEPLTSASLELVASLFNLSKRDPTLRSEKIGDYSYAVGQSLNLLFSQSGQEPGSLIAQKIAPYCRKLVRGC